MRLQKKGKSAVVDLYFEALYLFCFKNKNKAVATKALQSIFIAVRFGFPSLMSSVKGRNGNGKNQYDLIELVTHEARHNPQPYEYHEHRSQLR